LGQSYRLHEGPNGGKTERAKRARGEFVSKKGRQALEGEPKAHGSKCGHQRNGDTGRGVDPAVGR